MTLKTEFNNSIKEIFKESPKTTRKRMRADEKMGFESTESPKFRRCYDTYPFRNNIHANACFKQEKKLYYTERPRYSASFSQLKSPIEFLTNSFVKRICSCPSEQYDRTSEPVSQLALKKTENRSDYSSNSVHSNKGTLTDGTLTDSSLTNVKNKTTSNVVPKDAKSDANHLNKKKTTVTTVLDKNQGKPAKSNRKLTVKQIKSSKFVQYTLSNLLRTQRAIYSKLSPSKSLATGYVTTRKLTNSKNKTPSSPSHRLMTNVSSVKPQDSCSSNNARSVICSKPCKTSTRHQKLRLLSVLPICFRSSGSPGKQNTEYCSSSLELHNNSDVERIVKNRRLSNVHEKDSTTKENTNKLKSEKRKTNPKVKKDDHSKDNSSDQVSSHQSATEYRSSKVKMQLKNPNHQSRTCDKSRIKDEEQCSSSEINTVICSENEKNQLYSSSDRSIPTSQQNNEKTTRYGYNTSVSSHVESELQPNLLCKAIYNDIQQRVIEHVSYEGVTSKSSQFNILSGISKHKGINTRRYNHSGQNDFETYGYNWVYYLKQREHFYQPWQFVFSKSSHLEKLRLRLVERYWLTAKKFSVSSNTIYMAISNLNRLLNYYVFCDKANPFDALNSTEKMELIATLATLAYRIACKMEECPEVVWRITNWIDIISPAFSKTGVDRKSNEQLAKMECDVLRVLEYTVNNCVPSIYIWFYLRCGEWPVEAATDYYHLALYIVGLATFCSNKDKLLIGVEPSKLCLASVILSIKIINNDRLSLKGTVSHMYNCKRFQQEGSSNTEACSCRYEHFPERLQHIVACKYEDIQPVIRGLSWLLKSKPTEAYVLKYAFPAWGEHDWK